MPTISHNGQRLAIHIPQREQGEGLQFFSDDGDFVQVGTWGYNRGRRLAAHVHNQVPRQFSHTQEAIYVITGRVLSTIYTHEGIEVDQVTLEAGDILVLLTGGHGYEILEDGTRVLEVKNGPYPGAEVDRRRLKEAG